jgi:hypothetical protein
MTLDYYENATKQNRMLVFFTSKLIGIEQKTMASCPMNKWPLAEFVSFIF